MNSASSNSRAVVNERRRFLLSLALLAPTLTASGQGVGLTRVTATPAPPLRLLDNDDRAIDLAAYRGRVVLVNFWATWCPPCRKEFPSLTRVRRQFKRGDFEVLAVNVGEDPETVFGFAGHTEFPVLFDRDSAAMGRWPAKGLPTTFVVDRRGQLAFKAVGGREFDDPAIVSTLKNLL